MRYSTVQYAAMYCKSGRIRRQGSRRLEEGWTFRVSVINLTARRYARTAIDTYARTMNAEGLGSVNCSGAIGAIGAFGAIGAIGVGAINSEESHNIPRAIHHALSRSVQFDARRR